MPSRQTLKYSFFTAAETLGLQRLLLNNATGRVRVVLFHSVIPDGETMPNAVTVSEFHQQMTWLAQNTNVVGLTQEGHWRGLRDDALNVHVSFDDGFVNTLTHAVPVLRALGLTASFFLLAEALRGRRPAFLETYQRRGTRKQLLSLMKPEHARELLHAGMCVGSHSQIHCDFRAYSTAQAVDDAKRSRDTIEEALGCRVGAFAFPWGFFSPPQLAPLLAHYERLFLTAHGLNTSADRVCCRNEVESLTHLKATVSGLVDVKSLASSRYAPTFP
jgi:peptidoglycan/xylan/chitin deacetylase (PgdA/CDA1 family)